MTGTQHIRSTGNHEKRIPLARIVRAQGIRGEVRADALTERPERLEKAEILFLLKPDGTESEAQILASRLQGEQLILKLKGIDDRNGAESLKGSVLAVPESEWGPAPEGSHYVADLIGLKVISVQGEAVGIVKDVLNMPAHDVYVIDTGTGEAMVPAVEQFVRTIDPEKGIIVIDPIEGLLEP